MGETNWLNADAAGSQLPPVDLQTDRPHPAWVYDYLLLRHEALRGRAGVRDPRRRAVAAA